MTVILPIILQNREGPVCIFLNAMQLSQIVRLKITLHFRTVVKEGPHTLKIPMLRFPILYLIPMKLFTTEGRSLQLTRQAYLQTIILPII